ncbi:TNR1B-like protein [Mya arenaria]|uniref:TNR1B-like protein n=1 Tax=Mya arenaria TaxID=6604 RepID=A0ABY7DZ18_MYAAR|nr:TNR1B-like protein [Mya arenaria]
MESVILVVVLAVFTPGISAQFNDSYYLIEVNRETIQCKMCPPGAYWIQHCSKDGGQAICMDCPYDRFSEDYNRALYCKRCTKCKGNDKESGEVVAEACTRFHDTKCECKLGYWREKGIVGDCREVSPCKPGYGVKKMAHFLDSVNPNYNSYYTIDESLGHFNVLKCCKGDTAIMIRNNIGCKISKISTIEYQRSRLFLTKVPTYLFCIYMPSCSDIELFKETLKDVCALFNFYSRMGNVILAGDFNAHINSQLSPKSSTPKSRISTEFIAKTPPLRR